MASFNRVILMGNLTRDVELKYLQSGTAVTEIGLAVNNRRKTQTGEWVEEPVFVDVTLWGRTAEIASEYLGKGSPVLVEGRLKYDTWETEGQKRSKLRVVGERMQMVSARDGSPATSQSPKDGPVSQAQYGQSDYSEPAGVEVSSSGPTGPPEDEVPF